MSKGQSPAGWYPDPAGDTSKIRYWDGTQWTDQTQDVGVAGAQNSYSAPIAPQPMYAQEQQMSAPGNPGSAKQNTTKDKLAIAAFILGISSLVCLCCVSMFLGLGVYLAMITCVLSIVFGIIGIKSSRKGFAIIGIILGAVVVAIIAIAIYFVLVILPDVIANPTQYGLDANYFKNIEEQLGFSIDELLEIYS